MLSYSRKELGSLASYDPEVADTVVFMNIKVPKSIMWLLSPHSAIMMHLDPLGAGASNRSPS